MHNLFKKKKSNNNNYIYTKKANLEEKKPNIRNLISHLDTRHSKCVQTLYTRPTFFSILANSNTKRLHKTRQNERCKLLH